MKSHQGSYEELINFCKEIDVIASVNSLLCWDQETMLPKGSIEHRSDQISSISKIVHSHWTSSMFEKLLSKCIDLSTGSIILESLSFEQKRQVFLVYKDWLKKKALPVSFVSEFSKLASESTFVWQQAKKQDDYSKFEPYLSRLVEMSTKKAQYYSTKTL